MQTAEDQLVACLVQAIACRDDEATARYFRSFERQEPFEPMLRKYLGALIRRRRMNRREEDAELDRLGAISDVYMHGIGKLCHLINSETPKLTLLTLALTSRDARQKALVLLVDQTPNRVTSDDIERMFGYNTYANRIVKVRPAEADLLSKLGPVASPATRSICLTLSNTARFSDDWRDYQSTQKPYLRALRSFGPSAREAVPWLMEELGRMAECQGRLGSGGFYRELFGTLVSIGNPSIPALLELARTSDAAINRYGRPILRYAEDARSSLRAIRVNDLDGEINNPTDDLHAKISDQAKQLKLFYLLGRFFKEGNTSIRAACKAARLIEEQFFAEDLPFSNVTFSTNSKRLEGLFGQLFRKENFRIFEKRHGFGDVFTDDAWGAWAWADEHLRSQLPSNWFGFSRLSPDRRTRPK